MLIVNSVILIVALIKTTQAAVVTRNIMRVTYECCKIVLSSGNFLGYYFCLLWGKQKKQWKQSLCAVYSESWTKRISLWQWW